MTIDSLTSYVKNREELLAAIVEALSADERFEAAWLTGSFGRGDSDAISDLDLTAIVADAHSAQLCARPWQAGAQTTPERFALLSRFGQPILIHENHHNAPAGGTFTFVLYAESALMIDWVLQPRATAERPIAARLLFDKAGLSISPPQESELLKQPQEMIAERIAFFWMMTAVTMKYAIRRDQVFVQCWLENLHGILREVEQFIAGQVPAYHPGSITKLQKTFEEQLRSLRYLCERMLKQMTKAAELGVEVPDSPMPTIEVLLALASQDVPHQHRRANTA